MAEDSRSSTARLIAAAVLIVAIVAVIWFLARGNDLRGDADREAKPKVGVLSSMPIFWREGDIASSIDADGASSQLHARLSKEFDLVPVDNWDTVTEARPRILLLVQSRALTPKEMELFHNWVRDGGRALILADPALRWEGSYPLGDPRRPLFTSMLSPLLKYWGLALALPMDSDQDRTEISVGGHNIVTSAPGIWEQIKLDGNCAIAENSVVAECSIGKGRAILFADADIVDPQYWQGTPSVFGNGDVAGNMEWLEQALIKLSQ